jgi:hypothetical protein
VLTRVQAPTPGLHRQHVVVVGIEGHPRRRRPHPQRQRAAQWPPSARVDQPRIVAAIDSTGPGVASVIHAAGPLDDDHRPIVSCIARGRQQLWPAWAAVFDDPARIVPFTAAYADSQASNPQHSGVKAHEYQPNYRRIERTPVENMLDRNREALIATARGLSDANACRRLVRR